MDSGFDGKRREEEADRFFGHKNRLREEKREDRIKFLEKQNTELMEHIVYLKKNGYTYDQLTTKMNLCDRCGGELIKEDSTYTDNMGYSKGTEMSKEEEEWWKTR